MTTNDIRALLDAAAKATPGDRVAFYKHKYDEWNVSLPIEGSTMRWALFDDGIRTERPEADAKFIAAASPDVVASLARIAHGVVRYVVNARQPFLVMSIDHQSSGPDGGMRPAADPLTTITAKARHALIAPTLIQTGYGERDGQAPRVPGLDKPLGTVVGTGKHAVVAAFLAKHYGGVVGQPLQQTLGTITARDHHSLVMAFLLKYYGTDQDPRLTDPLHTITSRDRFGLVTVQGQPHYIADIGMRMLQPRELFKAQGFPDDVQLLGTKTSQVALCGNSVSPPVAAAIVRANCVEQVQREAA